MRRCLVLLFSFSVLAACGGAYKEDASVDAGAADSSPPPFDAAGAPDSSGAADAGESRDSGDTSPDAGVTTLTVNDVSLRDDMEASVSVAVTRPAGAAAPLEVTLDGLPGLIKVTPAKVALGASDATATFKLSRDVGVAAGDFKVTARAAGSSATSTATFNVQVVAGGGLDPSFGSNGAVILPGAGLTAFGPDGSLFLISTRSPGFSVEKRTPGGDLDTTFGPGGTATTASNVPDVFVQRAAVGPQGELIVGSEERSGSNRAFLVRFAANGSFDATYGGTGLLTIPAPAGSTTRCRALTVRPTGEALLGYTYFVDAGSGKPALAQFLANGQPDPTFTDPTPANLADYAAVRALPGGDVVAAGYGTTEQASVMRFRTSPPAAQTLSTWGHSFAAISGVEGLPDGSVFAAGFASNTGSFRGSSFAAARYDPSLVIVSPLTSAWSKRIGTNANATDNFHATALDSRQRLVAAGTSDGKKLVVGRFTRDGFDPGFGSGGLVLPVSGEDVYSAEIVALPSGRIGVAVHVASSTQLFRLLP